MAYKRTFSARKRRAPQRDEPQSEEPALQPPKKAAAATQTSEPDVAGQPGIPGVPPFSGEHEDQCFPQASPTSGQSGNPGPSPTLAVIDAQVNSLFNKAFAPATHNAYNQGITSYELFCSGHGISPMWPASEESVARFVAKLSLEGRAHSTVRTYLSGISSKLKRNSWPDTTTTFIINKLLVGLAKEGKHPDSRFPITATRLAKILSVLPIICSNSFEALLFRAAFSLSFFGLFRVSEIVGQAKSLPGGRPPLQSNQVVLGQNEIKVTLLASKSDQSAIGHSVFISAQAGTTVCPVAALRAYCQQRPSNQGHMFSHFDGSPLSYYQFQAVLKKAVAQLGWQTKGFSSHSFRIGRTTDCFMAKMPISTIMKLGRWKSGAVHKYNRPQLA